MGNSDPNIKREDNFTRRDTPMRSTQDVTDDEFEDEGDSSDDDEYLKEGEPYGVWMPQVPNPYVRQDKVAAANKQLQTEPPRQRRRPVRVSIREDQNKYYSDKGQDTGSLDTERTSGTSVGSKDDSLRKRS